MIEYPLGFTCVLDAVPHATLVVTWEEEEERIEYASGLLQRLFDVDVDPLVGGPCDAFWNEIVPRTDNPLSVREGLHRVRENHRETRTDYLRLVRPEQRVIERHTAPILDGDGEVVGRIWVFREVTRQFETKDSLQASRKQLRIWMELARLFLDEPVTEASLSSVAQRLSAGLEVGSVIFFPVAAADRILPPVQFHLKSTYALSWPDPALVALLEDQLGNLRREGGKDPVGMLDLSDLPQALAANFQDREIAQWVMGLIQSADHALGILVIEETALDLERSDDHAAFVAELLPLLALWWDRERLARHINAAEERAEVAARSRTDFIALLSHELRTPLNPLIGFTQLLEESCDQLPDFAGEMVRRISDGSRRLRELVEDLLTLTRLDARLEGWRKYVCDPRSIVADSCAWGRELAAAKKIEITLEEEGDLGVFNADGAAVRRALNALLSNAVRFSPEGSQVIVVATGAKEYVQVRVVDRGPGVPPEQKARIFEPFVQGEPVLTRRYGGAGIGLTLVQRVADSHSGSTWVEDGANGGSIFFLRLPRNLT